MLNCHENTTQKLVLKTWFTNNIRFLFLFDCWG